MSHWQNYRLLKELGQVSPLDIDGAGYGDREIVVIGKAQFDQFGRRMETDIRETVTIDELERARGELLETVADIDALLADARPKVEEFRAEREAQRKIDDALLKEEQEREQAQQTAISEVAEEADPNVTGRRASDGTIIFHPAKSPTAEPVDSSGDGELDGTEDDAEGDSPKLGVAKAI